MKKLDQRICKPMKIGQVINNYFKLIKDGKISIESSKKDKS